MSTGPDDPNDPLGVIGVQAYGAALPPYSPSPRQPAYPYPTVTTPDTVPRATFDLTRGFGEPAKPVKLRVSAMVEADGTLRLKVYADDRLVVETGGRGTVSIESEVPR